VVTVDSEMILLEYTSVDRQLSTVPVAEFPVATDVAISPNCVSSSRFIRQS
jgi:hypothetical protein